MGRRHPKWGMIKTSGVVAALLLCTLELGAQSTSANSGTIRGAVLDPQGAAIPAAAVQIENPVSHYSQKAQTDDQGKFEFHNIPFNNYHLSATAAGFGSYAHDVEVRSPIPVEVNISMKIGTETTSVTVESSGDLVEADPVTHTDVDRTLFDKLPLSGSSSLSSLVTMATPGVSADSNGLFHGLGDHASNSFSVDGQQITDQQSKVFSNQIPTESVQSMEVIEGAPPAEYGDKTSLVIVVTTRSGMGTTTPTGSISTSFGSFGTSNSAFDLAYGGKNWGNFIALSGLNTNRFLDTPEFAIMHDRGNEENLFDRLDFRVSNADTVTLNFSFTRSWFQTPNSFDAQNATAWNGLIVNNNGLGPNGLMVGSTDQRSKIRTFNIAPTWTHLIGASTLFTFGAYARQDQYNYYPSDNPFSDFIPDLQSESVGQSRRLTNMGLRTSLSYAKGIHNFKAGITYSHTLITEKDALALVDPTFDISSSPLLACIDLTLTGNLPGCPGSASAPFTFNGHADIRELAVFVQDSITIGKWNFNLGVRGDAYNGITSRNQVEPRVGIAYNIKQTGTVIRASYARTLETPFNENLVLASLGCNDPTVNALMTALQGYPCLTTPLKPGFRNEYHAGLQQAFGKHLVIDGEYIWKYTNGAYDFSVLGNTPITFPIEWARSKIPGYAIRASVPTWHGFSAYIVLSSVAARFFTPQISGLGATPSSFGGGSGVFRIDHDELFNSTTHLQYQIGKRGPWISFNWRFDSGQVAGAVPCAGGQCANGPNGTDSTVDVSTLTPDQQFQAGLFCGTVHATPTSPISATGLCPASMYGSTLLSIPAAGTENNDLNPPRVAPRNLFDLSIGHDNLFHGDRYKWSARIAIVNITNKDALYNFLSTFSGTHYVTPRAVTGTIGFHF